jgi:uncharacterized membrane protein
LKTLFPALMLILLAGCRDGGMEPSGGVEPSIEFVALSQPVDMTPDGSVAAIQDGSSPVGDLYFYHTASRLLEHRTRVGDPLRTFATGIAANGTVTALHGEPVQAGFWTSAAEWTDLSSPYRSGCDQDRAGAWDVSADGRAVVGLVWNGCDAEGFRWDADGSGIMTPLERLGASYPWSSAPPANRATVISDDGTVAAGWAQTSIVDRWPALWHLDGTGTLLPGLAPDVPGEVLSISADGKVVAGTWGVDAFYWTQSTGTVFIGQLPGADPIFDPTFANAIAARGKLIFGGCGSPFFSLPRAFVWTAGSGMRPLADVAAAHGVEIPEGYLLTNVLAASADGTVVLGTAYDPNSNQVTFVLHLPVSAYGL